MSAVVFVWKFQRGVWQLCIPRKLDSTLQVITEGSYRYCCLSSLVFIIFIHSFISVSHHYVCVVPNVDIILQSGWFWATSIASFRERFSDSRSCWVVFIHVVRGRPDGLLQFSKGEAVKICLASDSSDIHAMWPNRERRRAFTYVPLCHINVHVTAVLVTINQRKNLLELC